MTDIPGEEKKRYTAAVLPVYTAQTGAVNSVYDTALASELAALGGSYETSKAALEARRPAIAREYQSAGNALASDYERSAQAWGEYAAASGLNSGAGGQAALAREMKYQGSMAGVRQSEAEANTALDNEIARLQLEYRSAAAKARAQSDYARAAALLGEYQKAEQSRISVAGSQADENWREYSADRSSRSDLEQQAKDLAKYGDFSGYAALGYSGEAIAGMSAVWAMQNPLTAYRLGRISANEYYRYTGRYPAGYGYRGSNTASPVPVPTPVQPAAETQSGGSSGGSDGLSHGRVNAVN